MLCTEGRVGQSRIMLFLALNLKAGVISFHFYSVGVLGIDCKIHCLFKGKWSLWRMDDPEIGVIPLIYLLHPYVYRVIFDFHLNAVFIDTLVILNPGHN